MNNNILYTFRRCPYAIRARWALLIAQKSVVYREVSLRHKPQELLDVSPKGTVPVLLTKNGKIIDESIDIIHWALANSDKSHLLCVGDTKAQNEINYILDTNDGDFKYHLDRYKYSERFVISEKEFHKSVAREILLGWNERISFCPNNYWLVKGRETIADLAVWPFVRQYRIADPISFDEDTEISKLKKWLEYYVTNMRFERVMLKLKPWCPKDKPTFSSSN